MMETSPPGSRPVVLVTGLSGAGKASILRALEDQGFETIDNPPLPVLADMLAGHDSTPLAVGIDSRTRGFAAEALLSLLDGLRGRRDMAAELVFATAEEAVLLRRYSETRRRHPMSTSSDGARVVEGVRREAFLLAPLREAADLVIDTSDLPLPDLRRMVEARFGRRPGVPGMAISLISFAFPKGLPREADLVLDMRFLRNPHYDPALKPLTGRDPAVAEYIAADPDFGAFWTRMTALLDPLLPRYAGEGKKYLTIALGCTGGKHRSVLVAERLAHHFSSQGWRTDLTHREIAGGRPGSATGEAGRDTSVKLHPEGLEALTRIS